MIEVTFKSHARTHQALVRNTISRAGRGNTAVIGEGGREGGGVWAGGKVGRFQRLLCEYLVYRVLHTLLGFWVPSLPRPVPPRVFKLQTSNFNMYTKKLLAAGTRPALV